MHCLIHTQIYIGLKIVNALSHTHTDLHRIKNSKCNASLSHTHIHTQTYILLKIVNALSHTHTPKYHIRYKY